MFKKRIFNLSLISLVAILLSFCSRGGGKKHEQKEQEKEISTVESQQQQFLDVPTTAEIGGACSKIKSDGTSYPALVRFSNWSNTPESKDISFVISEKECMTSVEKMRFLRKETGVTFDVQITPTADGKSTVNISSENCAPKMAENLIIAYKNDNTAISEEFAQSLRSNAERQICPALKLGIIDILKANAGQ